MTIEMRKTGIDVVGDMPWGTHFCLFYETTNDILDTVVPYCKAGLENDEFCLWVVAEPLNVEEAKHALSQAVADLDRYLTDRSIEILPARDWYLHDGVFDLKKVTASWHEQLNRALARGYAGVRVTGDTAWLENKDWKNFLEYEEGLNEAVANQRLAVLCTYPLASCGAMEILDVVRTHQFAVTKRQQGWDVIETAGVKQAKAEIMRLNAGLEQRVEERTHELTALNEELRKEILERKRAEQALENLAARLIDAQEEERSRIGRELHDHISQNLGLLTIKIDQLHNDPGMTLAIASALDDLRQGAGDVTDDVHRLSHRLHSSTLDYLGLVPAIQKLAGEFSARHGVSIDFAPGPLPASLPSDVALCLFRVTEASLANVAKHSHAKSARIDVRDTPEGIHLTVEDDGIGFEMTRLTSKGGLGFVSMQERLRALRGTVRVDSAPSRGTRIDVLVPPRPIASPGDPNSAVVLLGYFAAVIESARMVWVFASSTPMTSTLCPANGSGVQGPLNL
jgi:signal transduction histidine kinase